MLRSQASSVLSNGGSFTAESSSPSQALSSGDLPGGDYEGIDQLLNFDFDEACPGDWNDDSRDLSGQDGSGVLHVANPESAFHTESSGAVGQRRVFPGFGLQHSDSGDPVGAKPAGKGTMSRSFVFTVNTGEHFPDYQDRFSKVCSSFDCRYGIIGAETAPSTGRRHYQGYIYRGTRLPWSKVCAALKEAFGVHPYVAVAKGDHEQNRAYCAKEGAYFEYGDLPRAGVS